MGCLICNYADFDQISLGSKLLDASDFHDLNLLSRGFDYVLATCKNCGHSAIQTDNPCLLPTRKHDFIKYGEPTEHYSKITSIIRELDLNFSDVSIHTFSYKDFQLANFLASELKISDVSLNDHANCSDAWIPTDTSTEHLTNPLPLEKFFQNINSSLKSHQIILITRFLDHVASYSLLQKMLNLISPTRHLIFDLNDYDRLFKNKTLEFIWNERRNFFRRSALEQIFQNNNLNYSIFSYESLMVSPTLTGVISSRLTRSKKSAETDSTKDSTANLVEKLISLRKLWRNRLGENHKLGIIGSSHKGVSLAQFVLDNHVAYSLHDDKEALRGKIPPVAPPLGFHPVSGFDFSEYTHIAITTTLVIAAKIIPKLRASGYEGEILDFDCRKLD